MLHQAEKEARDRKSMRDHTNGVETEGESKGTFASIKQRVSDEIAYRKKLFTFKLADKIIVREYDKLREAIGGTAHELANQVELTRLGHPYYNSKSGGGEGHLEVAKNIYYMNKGLAHMVLSLKPFGCMPSTQSDGAQAAVTSHFKDMIYIPIETSGEGDINAHSRVQMALGEAKVKCKDEFKAAVEKSGYTIEQIREYVMQPENRDLRRPLQHIGHRQGIVGKAANFVLDVAERMKSAGVAANGAARKEELVAV
jgi:hypothetical protein